MSTADILTGLDGKMYISGREPRQAVACGLVLFGDVY